MRIAVMGTGGVGGYFGARLARAGHDVAFVARGRQLEALRARGVDLVLFGVKLWDAQVAADAVKPPIRDETAVVSFQNGVLKDDILRQALGAENVIGGVCYIAATIAEPGLIRHSGTLQKLAFGEYDGTLLPRVQRFRDACVDSGIDVEVSDRIEQTIWEKFVFLVFLVGLSGTTSTARSVIGPIRADPRSRAYLERGNRIEVAWLSGDVVERGARLGVATPCNRAILDILSVHGEGAA